MMAAVYQTAYPRIRDDLAEDVMGDIYNPTQKELAFVRKHCKKQSHAYLGLLIQLKIFQRLGRFVPLADIPLVIIKLITKKAKSSVTHAQLQQYFKSGTKDRHIKLLRSYLNVKPYESKNTSYLLKSWAVEAATTKEKLADIINILIETLVKECFELPSFATLRRIAQSARSQVNNEYYRKLHGFLNTNGIEQIDLILNTPTGSVKNNFGWNTLKSEPKKPTPKNVQAFLNYLQWLKSLQEELPIDLGLPPIKHQQYINEAKSLDYSDLQALKTKKRYAMVVVLIRHQYAQTLDNAANIFIKIINKLDRTAEKKLDRYLVDQAKKTDHLIGILSETVKIYMDAEAKSDAMDKVLGNESAEILRMCNEHLAFTGNNYLTFMLPLYKKKRKSLFQSLEILQVNSATEDKDLVHAIDFIFEHKKRRDEWICIQDHTESDDQSKNNINIHWVRDKWWKLVTGKSKKTSKITHINKGYFELCVFVRVAEELDTGDVFIPYSEKFDDYREQLVTWEEYFEQLESYLDQVGLIEGDLEFTNHLRQSLTDICHKADQNFPENEFVRIEKGNLIVSKGIIEKPSKKLAKIDAILKTRMEKKNILDVITDVESWLKLSDIFGPLSGFESKIDDPGKRFVLTQFCYGTNIGPTETERSVRGISRKQVAWLNIKRVTEDRLDKATVKVINAYKQFRLPKYWGSGKSASADGKLWNLYEDNLLSEYHIRYGSYGGIAYYHISDTYIALFSRFISCGVYEAIYILDGLLNEQSEYQTDTLHGDTHAQSTPVFGLAYLLGIKLMPRIRNIKDLKFYKPDRKMVLEHIACLFSDPIKWDLIQTHYADMMRLAISIKNGKITASTILRRFSTKNRKNKLYFAFRELGRVVRTMYLLEYISDLDLRKTVQAATCKSEEFNQFANWLFFANRGVIASNLKGEQSKIVKYNHLLANISILYNVNEMTKVFNRLKVEGFEIDEEDMAGFSPYRTEHLGRLGSFNLDMQRSVEPMNHDLHI